MKLLTILIFSLAMKSMACDCTGSPFLRSTQNSALVVLVEIESQEVSSVKVKINELIKGAEKRKQVKVQGDRGADCLSSIRELKPGTRWIMALEKDSSFSGDYQLSSCGHHYAKVEKDNVIGFLNHTYLESKMLEKLPIDEIKKRIKSTH